MSADELKEALAKIIAKQEPFTGGYGQGDGTGYQQAGKATVKPSARSKELLRNKEIDRHSIDQSISLLLYCFYGLS